MKLLKSLYWRFRVWRIKHLRWAINGPWGLFILGPDVGNSDAGFTLNLRETHPFMGGDIRQWRHNLRVNVRWPIQIRYRSVRS